jgi:hypothetical protein
MLYAHIGTHTRDETLRDRSCVRTPVSFDVYEVSNTSAAGTAAGHAPRARRLLWGND